MAFKYHKHKPSTPTPSIVYETVKVLHPGKACTRVEFLHKSAHSKPIPSPSDYKLSLLIQSGVRLDKAPTVIDESINENDVDFLNTLNTQEDETI